MSSIPEKLAVMVRPPRQGEVYRVPITIAGEEFTIPAGWQNKMLTLQAVGQNCQFFFGLAAADLTDLTLNAESDDSAPPALVADDGTGYTLHDGDERSYLITDETQFALIGAADSGFLEMHLSSQPYNSPGL